MLAPPNFKNLNLALRYLSFAKNSSPELFKLRQIHSLLIVSGFSDHSSFLTPLLLHCIYIPSFPRAYALSIFSRIRRRDVYTYNAVIRGFISDQRAVLLIYANMRREGVSPNKHTFPLLLKSKTQIPFQIFAHSIKFGFGSDHFVRNTLLSVCANGGFIECARNVFGEMSQRDVVAYTALMDGYVRTGRAREALELFLEMRKLGVAADEVAVVSALSAVGTLGCLLLGKWIHSYVESGRVVRDVYVCTALVNMYSKCSCCEDATGVFRGMPFKNSVSWNTLLSGYVQCSKFKDVLRLFNEMLVAKVEPNEAILATVLTACAHLGSLHQGRRLHSYIESRKLELTSVLGTALIDMYAKCGSVEEAFLVFERVSVKDVYPWTALIFGVAMNGDAVGALTLFSQMLSSGIRPNEVTFIAVLSGCSHGGLVSEGQRLFEQMEHDYGIKPSVDHYGCMVDMLGRGGRLKEAMELIEQMPMAPSAGIWGALLGACMIHKDFEMGKFVGNHLIELQPYHSGRYALLANLYSKCGDEESAASVRRRMKEGGVGKIPGRSWIEPGGEVHEFVSSDKSHVEGERVYRTLDELRAQMEEVPLVMDAIFLEI